MFWINRAVCIISALTSDEHDADGKDLLRVGVRGHVSKTHASQAAEGEVQGCDVLVFDGGSRTWSVK